MSTKLAFVGGGSLRTLGVIRDWVLQGDVARDSEVVVMDLDPRRVRIISRLAQQMPELRGTGIRVSGTTDLATALDGADFVYLVIRVGGVHGMERDTRIGLKHGFAGHDDFGPSAAMIVLRTVPVVLDVAREMEKRCPDAWLLTFTNPVPFIVRAVTDFTSIKAMGFCGADRNQLWDIPRLLGWPDEPCLDFTYRGVGVDHFCWTTELWYKGEDFYPRLFEETARLDLSTKRWYLQLNVELLDLYGMWPAASHGYYWTHHDMVLEEMRKAFASVDAGEATAREDLQEQHMQAAEACIGQDLGEGFWQHDALKLTVSKPGLPAVGIQAVGAMLRDSGEEIMLNMHAPGAVGNLQDDGIVLLTARLHRDGPQPLSFDGVPDGIAPLTRQILAYQRALVHATMDGSRRALEVAILTDPGMRDARRVRAVLDELLEANRGQVRVPVEDASFRLRPRTDTI